MWDYCNNSITVPDALSNYVEIPLFTPCPFCFSVTLAKLDTKRDLGDKVCPSTLLYKNTTNLKCFVIPLNIKR